MESNELWFILVEISVEGIYKYASNLHVLSIQANADEVLSLIDNIPLVWVLALATTEKSLVQSTPLLKRYHCC